SCDGQATGRALTHAVIANDDGGAARGDLAFVGRVALASGKLIADDNRRRSHLDDVRRAVAVGQVVYPCRGLAADEYRRATRRQDRTAHVTGAGTGMHVTETCRRGHGLTPLQTFGGTSYLNLTRWVPTYSRSSNRRRQPALPALPGSH